MGQGSERRVPEPDAGDVQRLPDTTPDTSTGSSIEKKLVSHILVSDLLFSVTGFEQPAVARSFCHLIVVC